MQKEYNYCNMGRIIAFDIGNKRIGVALSDPFGQMALPLETYFRKNFEKDLAYLTALAKEKEAEIIVCGLPLNFDGSESEQASLTRSFVDELKKYTELPIVFQDERFSTLEARRLLLEADMRRDKRKNVIDKIAASYILEDYMRKNLK